MAAPRMTRGAQMPALRAISRTRTPSPRCISELEQIRWSTTRSPPARRTSTPRPMLYSRSSRYLRSQLPKPEPENERQPNQQPQETPQEPEVGRNSQLAATLASADTSDLVTEVHIPKDPDGVLPPDHPAVSILGNSSLVIQRQIEFMNIIVGFEQANRYIMMDGQGRTLGFIAERDHGFGSAMARQFAKTHRSFTAHVFDAQHREVLRIHRPFAYINSRIRIYDPVPEGGYPDVPQSSEVQLSTATAPGEPGPTAQVSPLSLEEMRIIGETQQQWAPLRRKYNLFSYRPGTATPADAASTPRLTSGDAPNTSTTALTTESTLPAAAIAAGMAQFASVNEPMLSWDFTLRDESNATMGSVNRNFGGFAREIFTDTGVYALRMDSAAAAAADSPVQSSSEQAGMTLDRRAVMLATAVSIDFDYFSRHSSHAGGGIMPMPIFWPMGTGGAAAEGGAVGAAGAAGAAEAGVVGAGAIAGAEAMRGYGGSPGGAVDDASPMSQEPFAGQGGQEMSSGGSGGDAAGGQGGDVWGESYDPWSQQSPGEGQSPPSAGGDGEGGGSWLDTLSDWFSD